MSLVLFLVIPNAICTHQPLKSGHLTNPIVSGLNGSYCFYFFCVCVVCNQRLWCLHPLSTWPTLETNCLPLSALLHKTVIKLRRELSLEKLGMCRCVYLVSWVFCVSPLFTEHTFTHTYIHKLCMHIHIKVC